MLSSIARIYRCKNRVKMGMAPLLPIVSDPLAKIIFYPWDLMFWSRDLSSKGRNASTMRQNNLIQLNWKWRLLWAPQASSSTKWGITILAGVTDLAYQGETGLLLHHVDLKRLRKRMSGIHICTVIELVKNYNGLLFQPFIFIYSLCSMQINSITWEVTMNQSINTQTQSIYNPK